MPLFALLLAALIGFANTAFSTCVGQDMRRSYSAEEQQAMRARIKDIPFAEGNHWRATRGAQVLHVIGTIHIDDPRFGPVVAQLDPLIRAADRVLVEATRADLQKLNALIAREPHRVFLTEGPTLLDLLSEAQWADVVKAAKERGIPGVMAAKFQPWYLMLNLSMPSCVLRAISKGARGLDHHIMGLAAEAGVEVSALEPFDTLFTVLGDAPMEQQITYLRYGTLPNVAATDATVTLLEAYFEEKPAEMLDLTRVLTLKYVDVDPAKIDIALRAQFERLLDQRNRNWLIRLLHLPDGLSIVAVGTGHLPGEAGLLNLLDKAGFTLERQTFLPESP